MATLRFKVQKITSGYVDVEVSNEELKALIGAHKDSTEVARKVRECAFYRAVNFDDEVVWEPRGNVKKEICGCPVIIYDFTDPVVIGEAVEDAGDGNVFLTYKIRSMENGAPSIIYGYGYPFLTRSVEFTAETKNGAQSKRILQHHRSSEGSQKSLRKEASYIPLDSILRCIRYGKTHTTRMPST